MPASIPTQDNSAQQGPEIDEAKERKRLQNRIAQRKFRERKAQQQLLANAAAASTATAQSKPGNAQNVDAKGVPPESLQWVGKLCPFTNMPIQPPSAVHSSAEHTGQVLDVKRDADKTADSFQCNKCGKRLFSILGEACMCTVATTESSIANPSGHQVKSPLGSHSGLTPPHDMSRAMRVTSREDEFPFDSNGYHVPVTMDMGRNVQPGAQFVSENRNGAPMHTTNKSPELHDFVLPTQVQQGRLARNSISQYSDTGTHNGTSSMVGERRGSRTQEMHQPLLHVAASNGHCKIVQMLLEHSFDINEQDRHGMTALHVAVRSRNEDIIRLLLQHGANAYVKDQDGQSPLHLAVQTGFENAVGMFLSHGVIHSPPS